MSMETLNGWIVSGPMAVKLSSIVAACEEDRCLAVYVAEREGPIRLDITMDELAVLLAADEIRRKGEPRWPLS